MQWLQHKRFLLVYITYQSSNKCYNNLELNVKRYFVGLESFHLFNECELWTIYVDLKITIIADTNSIEMKARAESDSLICLLLCTKVLNMNSSRLYLPLRNSRHIYSGHKKSNRNDLLVSTHTMTTVWKLEKAIAGQ